MGKSSYDCLKLQKERQRLETFFFDFSCLLDILGASELIGFIMVSEHAVSSSASLLMAFVL